MPPSWPRRGREPAILTELLWHALRVGGPPPSDPRPALAAVDLGWRLGCSESELRRPLEALRARGLVEAEHDAAGGGGLRTTDAWDSATWGVSPAARAAALDHLQRGRARRWPATLAPEAGAGLLPWPRTSRTGRAIKPRILVALLRHKYWGECEGGPSRRRGLTVCEIAASAGCTPADVWRHIKGPAAEYDEGLPGLGYVTAESANPDGARAWLHRDLFGRDEELDWGNAAWLLTANAEDAAWFFLSTGGLRPWTVVGDAEPKTEVDADADEGLEARDARLLAACRLVAADLGASEGERESARRRIAEIEARRKTDRG